MFELSVEREFQASHAITIGGEREPMHTHLWKVTVVVGGMTLDKEGLLCDFHDIEECLDGAIQPLHNSCLNSTPPFDSMNPTAENVAHYIATTIAPKLPDFVKVVRTSVTEAPGCVATYQV